MKRIYLLLFIPLTFIFGCKDALPDAEEYPVILTHSPTEVDETGATFQGELIREGRFPATSFGFVWGIKDQMVESANKIFLNVNPTTNKFSIRIDYALAKDVEYKIRAFVTSGDTTVYGNMTTFISKGSNLNGWTIADSAADISEPFYSCSDNEYGYLIYASSKAVRFDPATNKFTGIADFPNMIYSLQFMSVASASIQYLIYTNYSWLYLLADGKWSMKSRVPFTSWLFSGYYQGLSVNNKIFILSSYQSFMYDPGTDVWQPKARLPVEGGYSNGGTTLNGKAYVITTDNNLWEYDPETDKWTIKTHYPGYLGDRLVSFSYKDRLYFGISSMHQNINSVVDKRLWSYDLASNKWQTMEEFPIDHVYGGLFYFFLKDNLYVGMPNSGINSYYTLWKYDPSKMKN